MAEPSPPDCELAQRLSEVRRRVAEACARVGRDPSEVTIVGVTKTVGVDRIRKLLDAGLTNLGENRFQEAVSKMTELADRAPTWHFIGHLQTNKAERAVEVFDRIESLDSVKLARLLSTSAEDIGRSLHVFVQAKVGDEPGKHGVPLDEIPAFLREVDELTGIQVTGMMSIPPKRDSAEESREDFKRLHEVFLQLREEHEEVRHLSMGMSSDFEVAIEEGATEVRLGTVLFGERS